MSYSLKETEIFDDLYQIRKVRTGHAFWSVYSQQVRSEKQQHVRVGSTLHRAFLVAHDGRPRPNTVGGHTLKTHIRHG